MQAIKIPVFSDGISGRTNVCMAVVANYDIIMAAGRQSESNQNNVISAR